MYKDVPDALLDVLLEKILAFGQTFMVVSPNCCTTSFTERTGVTGPFVLSHITGLSDKGRG